MCVCVCGTRAFCIGNYAPYVLLGIPCKLISNI